MAVTFDAVGPNSAGDGGTGTSISWSHTCAGTNRYVVVGASIGGPTTSLSATFGGVTMTLLGTVASNLGTDGFVFLFGLINPPTGASTVTVTAGASRDLTGGSISFNGVDQTTPTGTAATGTSGTTSVSVAVPGTTVGNMVVATAGYGSGNVGITSSNQTDRYIQNLNGNTAAGSNAGATAAGTGGTVTTTWTGPANDGWGAVAVQVLAAPAGTTERFAPDAILAATGLTGAVTAIQDDPDSPDGNWLVA